MEEKNKVSVIIPIFKVRNFIERCARSLFEQTLKEIEYIFVDDASPDDSIDILKSCIALYPERKNQVRIIRHETNRGLTAARNTGLSMATGEFVAYCDSDDYVALNMYELLYKRASETQADLVLCDFYFDYGRENKKYNTISVQDKDEIINRYIADGWTVVWNMIVRRNIYEKYKVRSPENIRYCEDFHLTVRLMYYSKVIAKVNSALYYYNQCNNFSIMRNFSDKEELDERLVLSEIIDFFKEQGVFTEYQRELSWRVLKNKQDLVLSVSSHKQFMEIYPWAHTEIISCPTSFCNRKIKIMMWLLVHNCRFLLLPIIFIRNIIRK